MKPQVWKLGKHQIVVQGERFMGIWYDGSEIPATKVIIELDGYDLPLLTVHALPLLDMKERKIQDVIHNLSEKVKIDE